MGMALGGKARRGRGRAPINQINITPMVDVMLVLLIVFMVAAPLMTTGVPIDLPQARARAMPLKAKPITVTVQPDGALSIDGVAVRQETLLATIAGLANAGRDERLYVRGDTSVAYGTVMSVMGALAGAGYTHIGLVTTPEGPP